MSEAVTETPEVTTDPVEPAAVEPPADVAPVEGAGASDDNPPSPDTLSRDEVLSMITEARQQWEADQATPPEQPADSQAADAEPSEPEVHPDTLALQARLDADLEALPESDRELMENVREIVESAGSTQAKMLKLVAAMQKGKKFGGSAANGTPPAPPRLDLSGSGGSTRPQSWADADRATAAALANMKL